MREKKRGGTLLPKQKRVNDRYMIKYKVGEIYVTPKVLTGG